MSNCHEEPEKYLPPFLPFFLAVLIWLIIIVGVVYSCAKAETIDIDAIIQIESSGNPLAYNPNDGGRGLLQITAPVLIEYNKFNKTSHQPRDLFNPIINKKIGIWYMTKRIPQMLRYYGLPLTADNHIIAWNAGIKNARIGRVPKITKLYLKKYARLAKG